VVVPLAVPLKVTVAPLPPAAELIIPEILKVWAASVKFTPVTLAPFTATLWLLGVNVYPA
jgi:hypothetical protein